MGGVRTDDDQEGRNSAPITLTIVENPRHTFCILEPAPGACKVSTEQWFYNATEATCARFMYSGCGGNKNNFNTETECLSACHPQHTRRQRFRGLEAQSLTRERKILVGPRNGGKACPRKLQKKKRCLDSVPCP